MVIDTSAPPAILQNEPERRFFNVGIEAADRTLMSAATFVECSMILASRYGAEALRDLDHFIARAQITIVPLDLEHARIARDVFRRYRKGRHPAGLNFGDGLSYALSRTPNSPPLFQGGDFSQTAVQSCTAARHSIQDCGHRER